MDRFIGNQLFLEIGNDVLEYMTAQLACSDGPGFSGMNMMEEGLW
jgi:hypothetical protein